MMVKAESRDCQDAVFYDYRLKARTLAIETNASTGNVDETRILKERTSLTDSFKGQR